jgi:hypothetical protein
MSVNRDISDLPFMFVPKRYRDKVEGAMGSNSCNIFHSGNGAFKQGPINNDLTLHCAHATKGLVVPTRRMPIESFQGALAATRDEWIEIDP